MSMENAIRDAIVVPDDIRKTAQALNANIMEGPNVGTFSDEARTKVRNWLESLPTHYYDQDEDEVTTEGQVSCTDTDPETGEEFHYPVKDLPEIP